MPGFVLMNDPFPYFVKYYTCGVKRLEFFEIYLRIVIPAKESV